MDVLYIRNNEGFCNGKKKEKFKGDALKTQIHSDSWDFTFRSLLKWAISQVKLSHGKGSLSVRRLLWDLGYVLLHISQFDCGLITQPVVLDNLNQWKLV